MTRKEIEKRCREQMQQTIPDKNALWARIENNLPEQKPDSDLQPKPGIHRNILYRTLAAAACFLFVAAGLSLWNSQNDTKIKLKNDSATPQYTPDMAGEEAEEEVQAEGGYYADAAPEDGADEEAVEDNYVAAAPEDEHTVSETLTYADLDIRDADEKIADKVDRNLLHMDDEFFSLPALLEETECFADAVVEEGEQDKETGEIIYTLWINQTYGTSNLSGRLSLSTASPYLMEIGHCYTLPLCHDSDGNWTLTNASAPQVERTYDHKVLLHNGWYTLINEYSIPVLCDSNGKNDFFYDRMYLISETSLEYFLHEWEEGTL